MPRCARPRNRVRLNRHVAFIELDAVGADGVLPQQTAAVVELRRGAGKPYFFADGLLFVLALRKMGVDADVQLVRERGVTSRR